MIVVYKNKIFAGVLILGMFLSSFPVGLFDYSGSNTQKSGNQTHTVNIQTSPLVFQSHSKQSTANQNNQATTTTTSPSSNTQNTPSSKSPSTSQPSRSGIGLDVAPPTITHSPSIDYGTPYNLIESASMQLGYMVSDPYDQTDFYEDSRKSLSSMDWNTTSQAMTHVSRPPHFPFPGDVSIRRL